MNYMTTLLVAGALSLGIGAANAQSEWPQRPISLVVSQGAGAAPDILARTVAAGLSDVLGTPVVVENMPGGSNIVGANTVANADPDGYTLFFATSAALVNNPFLLADLPYDPMEDFDPVALVGAGHMVVVANPESGLLTLDDIIERAKESPGTISVGVDSPRSLAGIIARTLSERAGIELHLVSYSNITQALPDVLSGVIPLSIQASPVVTPYISEGTVHPVAVATSERAPALPDVASVSEVLPGFNLRGWFMIVAPSGMNADNIEKLNMAVREVVASQDTIEQSSMLGFDLYPTDVEDTIGFLDSEFANWSNVIEQLGIEAE